MEVFVDNILVKSKNIKNHGMDLEEAFKIHRNFRVKLNLVKYNFIATLGKLLGRLVT